MSPPSAGSTRRVRWRAIRNVAAPVCVAGTLAVLASCSGGDGSAGAPSSEPTTATDEAPVAGVESFCDEFVDVLSQDDPDFSRLDQAAPEEVKPEVSEVVEFSEMAATADEAPAEEVIDGFQRSVFGMTIYAVDNCDDVEQLASDLGLGDEQIEAVRRYSLDDVRDDEKWPEIKAAVEQQ